MKKIVIRKKDKVLLSGLACFLIVAAFIEFLYLPTMKEKVRVKKENSEIEQQIIQQNALIEVSQIQDEQIEKLEKELKDLEGQFYQKDFGETVEKKFTDLAKTIGLDSHTITLKYSEQKINEYKKEEGTNHVIPQYEITHHLIANSYPYFLTYIESLESMSNVVIEKINAKPKDNTSNEWSFDVTFVFYEYEK